MVDFWRGYFRLPVCLCLIFVGYLSGMLLSLQSVPAVESWLGCARYVFIIVVSDDKLEELVAVLLGGLAY